MGGFLIIPDLDRLVAHLDTVFTGRAKQGSLRRYEVGKCSFKP